jgi:hypothetical protein
MRVVKGTVSWGGGWDTGNIGTVTYVKMKSLFSTVACRTPFYRICPNSPSHYRELLIRWSLKNAERKFAAVHGKNATANIDRWETVFILAWAVRQHHTAVCHKENPDFRYRYPVPIPLHKIWFLLSRSGSFFQVHRGWSLPVNLTHSLAKQRT